MAEVSASLVIGRTRNKLIKGLLKLYQYKKLTNISWILYQFDWYQCHMPSSSFSSNFSVAPSVWMNVHSLQTEGPSQRTNDDDPGTFLLMRNIPCIMMATPSVVLAECDWRCVTSLFPSFITFKHFQKPRWTFLQSAYSVNRLNSQLLIMLAS